MLRKAYKSFQRKTRKFNILSQANYLSINYLFILYYNLYTSCPLGSGVVITTLSFVLFT